MPASTNKRIYYPMTAVAIKPGSVADHAYVENAELVKGLQSMGVGADNNLSPLFQLGMLEIYENFEELPDINLTLSKLLDGNPLIYHLATYDALTPTLVGRSTVDCFVGVAFHNDTVTAATGSVSPKALFSCSGMFVNSISYNMGVEGQFSEDATLVGNNRIWTVDGGQPPTYGASDHVTLPVITFTAGFPESETPAAAGGIASSPDMLFAETGSAGNDSNGALDDRDTTVLPPEVHGISNDGTNAKTNGEDFDAHIQSISVSTDLSREDLDELGRKGPYHKAVSFPIEVTTEITVNATEGDLISSTEEGIYSGDQSSICTNIGSNLKNRTIRIATCEGLRIYCGRKNKLQSVNHTGGDTDGGNVTVTYSYTNFNDFTIMHEQDPNQTYAWADRSTYLQETP